MQAIGFYLAIPFLYLISLLPFPMLYALSDVAFIFVYYVIGYRRKVVTQNLRNSFPEKSVREIEELRRKFYRHLCDLFLETFKTFMISREEMVRHCRMNPESVRLLQQYYGEKKSLLLVLGHLGNWEWGGNAFSIMCRHQLFVIYHPLENPYFNRLIIRMRTRFGTRLIEMKNTFRDMVSNQKIISSTAFIADQTPPPENALWTTFMNQETPVYQGTEKIARKLNYPVVLISVRKRKRGHYEIHAETICENPASTVENEITLLHTRKLEEEIRKSPETWLWSHKRWKHKRPVKN